MGDDQDNDFGIAIRGGLEAGNEYRHARHFVKELVDEVASALQPILSGVALKLLPRGQLRVGGGGSTIWATMARINGAVSSRERRVGDDGEDKEVNLMVVAATKTNTRILWELEFQPTGFPITMRGPLTEAWTHCNEEADLRRAFHDALRTSVVGRKLRALASTKTSPADGDDDVPQGDASNDAIDDTDGERAHNNNNKAEGDDNDDTSSSEP